MKRVVTVVVVVLVGSVVAVGAGGQVRRDRRERALPPVTVRHSALELDAAEIDHQRRKGFTSHFAVVPGTAPPGLVRMGPLPVPAYVDPDGVTDVYAYRNGRTAVVKFTKVPGEHPCGDQTCVRDGPVTPTRDATSLEHVAVWLTGPPSADDARMRRFWATTPFVPIGRSGWYTDLALEGESW